VEFQATIENAQDSTVIGIFKGTVIAACPYRTAPWFAVAPINALSEESSVSLRQFP
jgi:hypothetical protein